MILCTCIDDKVYGRLPDIEELSIVQTDTCLCVLETGELVQKCKSLKRLTIRSTNMTSDYLVNLFNLLPITIETISLNNMDIFNSIQAVFILKECNRFPNLKRLDIGLVSNYSFSVKIFSQKLIREQCVYLGMLTVDGVYNSAFDVINQFNESINWKIICAILSQKCILKVALNDDVIRLICEHFIFF